MAKRFNSCLFDPAVSMARQAIYRFTAIALLDPRAGAWKRLAEFRGDALLEEAAALLRGTPAARPKALAFGERPVADLNPSSVLRRLPESPGELNRQFEQTFGLLVSTTCPPYETEYINSKFDFQRSNNLADVGGFYRAFGMKPAASRPERHDHIVLELEFLAALIGLTRQALDDVGRESNDRVKTCLRAQERFVREHLAWWAPAFARLLAKENAGGFYEAAGELLAAFIPSERALLGIAPPRAAPAPTPIETPEECEGCALHGS